LLAETAAGGVATGGGGEKRRREKKYDAARKTKLGFRRAGRFFCYIGLGVGIFDPKIFFEGKSAYPPAANLFSQDRKFLLILT